MKKEKTGLITLSLRIAAGIVLGLCLLIWPAKVLLWLPIILGVLILLLTVIELIKAISLWHRGYTLWWIPLLLCLVLATPGILLITRQNISSESLVRLIGCGSLTAGIIELWFPIGKKSAAKQKHTEETSEENTESSVSISPYDDLPEDNDL